MNRTLFTVAYITLACILAGIGHTQLDDQKVAELVAKEARAFETDGDWDAAFNHYLKAAELHPTDLYRYRAAHAATQRKPPRWQEAERLLRQNDGLDSVLLLAKVYRHQKKWDDARQQLERAQSQAPDDPRVFRAWGGYAYERWRLTKQRSDAELGVQSYKASLAKQPNVSDRVQIQAHLRELEYRDAGRTLNRAIKVFRGGEFGRAWEFLDDLKGEKLKKRTAGWSEPAYWRGQICLAASERNPHYDATGATSERYWRQAESLPEARLALANFYLERGQPEAAKREAEAAAENAPNWAPPRLLLGRIHQATGEFSKARGYFKQVIELSPDSLEGRTARQELEINIDFPTDSTLKVDLEGFMKRYGPEAHNLTLLNRLEGIFSQLYTSNGSPETPPKIRLLASQSVNAWAVPPNQLFITIGLMEFVDTHPSLKELGDDVLAFVLGHEWSHILQRDYQNSKRARQAIAGLLQEQQIAWELLRSGLGRDAEEYADQQGLLFAYRAGYKPNAAIVWCEAKIDQAGDRISDGEHPSWRERQHKMQAFLDGQMQQAHRAFGAGVRAFDRYQQLNSTEHEDTLRYLEQAAAAFDRYLWLYPQDRAGLENLSVIDFLRGVSILDGSPWGRWRLVHDIQREPDRSPPSRIVTIQPEVRHRWERARRHARRLLQLNPNAPGAYQVLGDIAFGFGKGMEADRMYRKGLAISPAHRGLLNNLGVLHARRGDLKRAKELWTVVQDLPAAAWNLQRL